MSVFHVPGAFSSCHSQLDMSVPQETISYNVIHINSLIHNVRSIVPSRSRLCHRNVKICSFSKNFVNQFKIQRVSHQLTSKRWLVSIIFLHQLTSKRWLCRSQDSISPENEYRSSRNIAISLLRRYRVFVERGGGDNLKEFIIAGVNAYALGCTDEGLRKELADMKESGVEIEAMKAYGGSTSLKYKIVSQEIDECILWLGIVFITILCTPQPTVVRWSSTPSVSDKMLLQWKGFCAIIANAYYMRGMAWLPVKTLQMEQMAVTGNAEEPSVVASRMRLVFSTLEVVSPQWPRV
ncbi:uncharacterized protein [Henckelia pumila]|uniref:uncharacterized protein isoform X2 n=1 Tax=Henckelia pumila TaxID=405737 RepID=UPI003C6E8A44